MISETHRRVVATASATRMSPWRPEPAASRRLRRRRRRPSLRSRRHLPAVVPTTGRKSRIQWENCANSYCRINGTSIHFGSVLHNGDIVMRLNFYLDFAGRWFDSIIWSQVKKKLISYTPLWLNWLEQSRPNRKSLVLNKNILNNLPDWMRLPTVVPVSGASETSQLSCFPNENDPFHYRFQFYG